MIDAIETITEAIPCNIVYGRRQAAEGIARALSAAGFTIMSKEDVEAVRDKALEEAAQHIELNVPWHHKASQVHVTTKLPKDYAAAIRSLKSIPRKE